MGKISNKQKTNENNTVLFICEWCGKTKEFTDIEIEKQKKTDPDIKSEGFEYYIPCPSCHDGYMFSQKDVVFHQLATDLFDE